MRTILTTLMGVCFAFTLQSQSSFKNIPNGPYIPPQPLQVSQVWKAGINPGRIAPGLSHNQLHTVSPSNEVVSQFRVMSSGSFWIDLQPNHLWLSRASLSGVLENVLQTNLKKSSLKLEWREVSEQTDKQDQTHIRVQQMLGGYPIRNQDMVLHLTNGELRSLNGFAWTGALPDKFPDPRSVEEAIGAAKQFLLDKQIKFQSAAAYDGLHFSKDEASLMWIPQNGKLIAAYSVNMHPNALDHWTIYINASTLEVINSISETCSFAPMQLFHHVPATISADVATNESILLTPMPLLDGATTTNDQDLLGQTHLVNGYQIGTTFFLIDASRTSMFLPAQSKLPDDPVGTIWTIDAKNSSPQQSNFEVVHVTNTNNNWLPLEVSAHFNAGQAFEYYKNTFNRNSINGNGGNIISIINVTDENDGAMDNAFWSGTAMFYGNGNVAFTSLAKGLDVAGHEMSHGVIQSTANLEYLSQSGALNESYADVFGSLIDRDDWRIGEDVVKLNFFPSGALRDLSNPNNGGNGPGDNGWQPKHMNEYQTLPETPDGDNGGVHVNSGIPNRAYFLFANAVGKEKAEKVYYKALTDYLVKSSQFIDMRLAIEKSATDFFGANSAEVTAARSAFDQVGIGAGNGGDYEDDIDTNNGADFILATDGSESDLYFIPPTNPSQFVKLNVNAPLSRPSFTDDGAACVYVDEDHNMVVINFDWTQQQLTYQEFYIENNPQGIWRNVVVSKDGTKIAYTTNNLRNEINVFDFENDGNNVFNLYSPTTGMGIEAGDVLYPDVMEWDYSGEQIMYDALNRIESGFGDGIEYWDISFLNAWNRGADHFGTGIIDKLYSSLPENIGVGNPSFSKNSPYIITFDYVEDYFDLFGNLQTDYAVLSANIEAGFANIIWQNNTIGYPSYSRLDHKILFTYSDSFGDPGLATIDIQSGDKTLPVDGTDVVLITGAQKGVWFNVGLRDFTATEDLAGGMNVTITPQPASETITIKSDGMTDFDSYSILTISGKELERGHLDRSQSIAIGSLPQGMYLLQMVNGAHQASTVKFVKQ